jgi:integrase
MLVQDMVAAYKASQATKVTSNKLEEGTKKRHVKVAERFEADFRGLRAAQITPAQLVEWLESFEFESPHTFNSYLRILRAIWAAAEVTPNTAKKVSFRDASPDEVAILTVEQAKALFAYGAKHVPWLMPKIAAEAFLGLRYSSAMRLEASDVNMADKGVLLPARKLKTGKRTGRRHYLDALPENFWAWAKLATPETWALTERQYMGAKSALFSDAKVPHPHNVLRHSACTYHVAAYKDAGKTATMLCHADQEMIWSTYNGVATNADGLAYFAITP